MCNICANRRVESAPDAQNTTSGPQSVSAPGNAPRGAPCLPLHCSHCALPGPHRTQTPHVDGCPTSSRYVLTLRRRCTSFQMSSRLPSHVSPLPHSSAVLACLMVH